MLLNKFGLSEKKMHNLFLKVFQRPFEKCCTVNADKKKILSRKESTNIIGSAHLVALSEELLHNPVHPELVHAQRLGGVGQVRAVHHVLQHLQQKMYRRKVK